MAHNGTNPPKAAGPYIHTLAAVRAGWSPGPSLAEAHPREHLDAVYQLADRLALGALEREQRVKEAHDAAARRKRRVDLPHLHLVVDVRPAAPTGCIKSHHSMHGPACICTQAVLGSAAGTMLRVQPDWQPHHERNRARTRPLGNHSNIADVTLGPTALRRHPPDHIGSGQAHSSSDLARNKSEVPRTRAVVMGKCGMS